MILVAFHCDQLSLRGVEVATFNYAKYNEEILGNKSLIFTRKNSIGTNELARQKFESRFEVKYYSNLSQMSSELQFLGVDVFYAQKDGINDGVLAPKGIKNLMHVVFQRNDRHGDVYCYVSSWLAKKVMGDETNYLPLIVEVDSTTDDLRRDLKIADDSTVFGRYGGLETFDLYFVKMALIKFALKNNDVFFIFMNTDNFIDKTVITAISEIFSSRYGKKVRVLNLILTVYLKCFVKTSKIKNIIFLPGSSDSVAKGKFINTCDAMLHARKQGESFGLACGEFSMKNKPVLTYSESKELAHVDMLGDKCLLYSDRSSLLDQLDYVKNKRHLGLNWDAYSEKFSPKPVMDRFSSIIKGMFK